MKNIYLSFTHEMAAKASWHWKYVTLTLVYSVLSCVNIGQDSYTDLDFVDDVSLPAELLELLVPVGGVAQW